MLLAAHQAVRSTITSIDISFHRHNVFFEILKLSKLLPKCEVCLRNLITIANCLQIVAELYFHSVFFRRTCFHERKQH